MAFQKNQILTLSIESLSNDGSGVAHHDGQAVFVAAAAPGDVAEVRIVKPMKGYAFGKLEKLLTPGPGRVKQDCPVAGPCGGCGLRHIRYEAECAAKTQFVRDAFARLGKLDVPVREVLAAPAADTDWEWVKPGLVSWDWWNGMRLSGVDFRAGRNTESYRYYIDFAAKYGVPYIIMDEGWSASTTDVFRPNPDLDLPGLIAYGKERNVQIVLWLTWLAVEKDMDRLFATLEEWGIPGVKIDFMDRSDQWMVNYYERVAKEAAKHKLFVDFHGAFKPAGLERKYPNVLSYEGVLGMEQGGNCKPENSIYLPFMRNAVGPMDFTPGSMISAQPEDNRSTRANAMGSGTRAFQMALFIIFESGLQMLADNPVYYYRELPCTEFITSVPVTWDETKVLYAKVGEAVVVAKRKGEQWFIGGITGNQPQNIEIDLGFIPAGQSFTLTSFEDGINADRQAMDYKKKESTVNNQTRMTLKMVRNGGWAGTIKMK